MKNGQRFQRANDLHEGVTTTYTDKNRDIIVAFLHDNGKWYFLNSYSNLTRNLANSRFNPIEKNYNPLYENTTEAASITDAVNDGQKVQYFKNHDEFRAYCLNH